MSDWAKKEAPVQGSDPSVQTQAPGSDPDSGSRSRDWARIGRWPFGQTKGVCPFSEWVVAISRCRGLRSLVQNFTPRRIGWQTVPSLLALARSLLAGIWMRGIGRQLTGILQVSTLLYPILCALKGRCNYIQTKCVHMCLSVCVLACITSACSSVHI